MKKKEWKIIALIVSGIVLFAATGIIFFYRYVPPQRYTKDLSTLLPDTTGVYFSTKDIRTVWARLEQTRFWNALSQSALVSHYLDVYRDYLGSRIGFVPTADHLMDVFGEEAVVSAVCTDTIQGVFVLSKTGYKARALEMMFRLFNKAQVPEKADLEEVYYQGISLVHVKDTEPSVAYAVLDDVVVFCISNNNDLFLKRAIELFKTGTGNDVRTQPQFSSVSDLIPADATSHGYLYFNPAVISWPVLRALLDDRLSARNPDISNFLRAIEPTTRSLPYGGGTVKIFSGPSHISVSYCVLWENAPIPRRTAPESFLAYLPTKKILYFSAARDLKKLWHNIKEHVPFFADAEASVMQQGDEIAAYLGDGIVVSMWGAASKNTPFPIPELLVMLKLNNKEDRSLLAQKISELIKQHTGSTNGVAFSAASDTGTVRVTLGVNIVPEVYREIELYTIRLPVKGLGIEPAYAILGDYLVLSSSVNKLKETADLWIQKGTDSPGEDLPLEVTQLITEPAYAAGFIRVHELLKLTIDLSRAYLIAATFLHNKEEELKAMKKLQNMLSVAECMKVVKIYCFNTKELEKGYFTTAQITVEDLEEN